MPYLIDGNNVIGQIPGWHRDKAGSRRDLIRRLADFAKSKRARIIVVFDGAPDAAFPDSSSFNGVKIFYADRGSDADSRIEKLVETSKDKRGLTVVTSDRLLGRKVGFQGAKVMRSGDFRKLMDRTEQADTRSTDKVEPVVDEMDSWLRYFGSLPTDDE
jgi:predicted RNA-binding protein with PIN domain